MPVQEKGTVRDLGFIAWDDPYAEFEDISGSIFKKAVKEEDEILNSYIEHIPKIQKNKWLKAFKELPVKSNPHYSFKWNEFKISIGEQSRLMPTLMAEMDGKSALHVSGMRGFCISDDVLVTIRDLSEGKESMTLEAYNSNLKKIITLEKVGETVTTDQVYLYYTEAEDTYWFNTITRMDMKTKKVKHLYKETDKSYVLRIDKPENQADIFVTRTCALNQDLGIIKNNKVTWLTKGFGRKKPINEHVIAYDSHFTLQNVKIDYPDHWKLVDASSSNSGYLFIFTKDACHSVYLYENKWVKLNKHPMVCEIKFSIAASKFIVGFPNKPDEVWSFNNKIQVDKTMEGVTYKSQHGKVPLPWFSIQSSDKPKAVVICGYGAYGMSMKKNQQRLWLPWLAQNFMIINICVRGGGENGDAWWDASRTAARRAVGINDFVKGVNFVQSKFGFTNKNTIIYGRSAGGLLVNAASFQLLNKITVVYAAKPYTDVLRTTSNLKEPQTIQESEEFGLSYNNPVDFYEIMKISPYENIEKTPVNPVILLTGGTHDTEVGPYMPLKYAKRLRDFHWKNVFCRIAKGEGHFTDKDKEDGEALDAALCESFLDI